jgi:hypothetical protein
MACGGGTLEHYKVQTIRTSHYQITRQDTPSHSVHCQKKGENVYQSDHNHRQGLTLSWADLCPAYVRNDRVDEMRIGAVPLTDEASFDRVQRHFVFDHQQRDRVKRLVVLDHQVHRL